MKNHHFPMVFLYIHTHEVAITAVMLLGGCIILSRAGDPGDSGAPPRELGKSVALRSGGTRFSDNPIETYNMV